MNIFRELAPQYWAAGLPAIPLRQRNKMPDVMQWSQFGQRMPDMTEQQHWLASFPQGNIGLALGPASGVCMIDIDTEDEDLIAAILAALPPSPWKRVGKKGMALAYAFEGQKNFKLRGVDGGMILEFLGLGNQVVLPGSIHPDTGLPYTSDTNLWEVKDKLPFLGEDIEDKLRALLGHAGFEIGAGGRSSPVDIVPAGERDVQMVRHAGYLARVVLGIDKSRQFSLAEAISQMHHWVSTFTAKVAGDAMDPDKGTAKLLEFLLKDLEKGRTMPENWDAGMPDEWKDHPSIKRMFELNESQRWDINRARGWLVGKIAEHPDDDGWALARVQELVQFVARDENFSEFEYRALVTQIVNICGKNLGLKKSDLLLLYKDAKKGDDGNEPESQHRIAKAVLEEMQKAGEIRFHLAKFWQWNGSCFQKLSEDDIYMHVATNIDSPLARTHTAYKQIVEVMQRMCRADLLQCEENGLNFANGFVGEDLRVVEHDPKYGCTFTLPFVYDRDNASKCTMWMAFLHSCWGMEPDFEQRVMALQEAFAATLFKIAPRYQRAVLLFGRAGTGKTQILDILRAMLPPDAVANLGPEKWGERFSLTELIGKAANICGELPENGLITGSVFKQVVEGSPVTTEYKNMPLFQFAPPNANWFASNYLPVSRDTTQGFTRRWVILDFNHPVKEEDKIENLAQIIVAEEREAIAAWALEGLRRVLDQRGYTLPDCHKFRLSQMRRINNSVQAFLEDTRSVALGDGEMTCKEVYDFYSFHIRDTGRNSPVSFERFVQMLEDLDLEVFRKADALGFEEFWVRGLVQPLKAAA